MAHIGTGLKTFSVSAFMACLGSAAYAGNYAAPTYTPDLLPPNPQAGECYARVEIPAQHSTKSQSVIIQDGYRTYKVSEPQITSRLQEIMIKEPSIRYEVRQPTYKTVTEQIMIRPAYDKLTVVQPSFKTHVETIRVSEPRLVWKRGNPAILRQQGYKIHSVADMNNGGRGYSETSKGYHKDRATLCGPACDVWCLVEDPGESISYNRKVLASPARIDRIPISAKYTSVTKQIVADPGGVREIPVPGEYSTITVEQVNSRANAHQINVPAEYGTVGQKVQTHPSRYEWRRIVCRPKTAAERMSSTHSRPVSSPYQGIHTRTYTSSQTGQTSNQRSSAYTHGSRMSADPVIISRETSPHTYPVITTSANQEIQPVKRDRQRYRK